MSNKNKLKIESATSLKEIELIHDDDTSTIRDEDDVNGNFI